MPTAMLRRGTGYLPDVPRIDDPDANSPRIARMLAGTRFPRLTASPPPDAGIAPGAAPPANPLPAQVDLRSGFSPVFDQGQLGSCTANAAAGLIDYFEKAANRSYVAPSRLFIYKVARDLAGVTGDAGAFLRTTMEALKLFGAPPESIWPYNSGAAGFNQLFDVEPTPFCYAYARNYAAVEPFRLDPLNVASVEVLTNIKTALAAGYPSVFGFQVYPGFENPESGDVFFPVPGSRPSGGHAIVAAGYDDNHAIQGKNGALIVRNSWGEDWGLEGYAYMPYEYVTQGLAVDWWTMTRQDWLDTGVFD